MSEHRIERHLVEVIIYPDHDKRVESDEFRANRERLIADGHGRCCVCGSSEQLQCHHYGCEYALWNDCDPAKLKDWLSRFDAYGYSRLLANKPIESVDDIRNLMMLCEDHHTTEITGIHESTFPIWQSQAWCKAGDDPVPPT